MIMRENFKTNNSAFCIGVRTLCLCRNIYIAYMTQKLLFESWQQLIAADERKTLFFI